MKRIIISIILTMAIILQPITVYASPTLVYEIYKENIGATTSLATIPPGEDIFRHIIMDVDAIRTQGSPVGDVDLTVGLRDESFTQYRIRIEHRSTNLFVIWINGSAIYTETIPRLEVEINKLEVAMFETETEGTYNTKIKYNNQTYLEEEWEIDGNIYGLEKVDRADASIKIYDIAYEEIELEACPYEIEISNLQEVLIKDDTWLHDLFYQNHGWVEGYRYYFTIRTKDDFGRDVAGKIVMVPHEEYAVEELVVGWPPRQYTPMSQYKDGFIRHDGFFTNVMVAKEAETPGYGNSELVFVFIPDMECYPVELVRLNMSAMREAAGKTDDHTTWGDKAATAFHDYIAQAVTKRVTHFKPSLEAIRYAESLNGSYTDGAFSREWYESPEVQADIDDALGPDEFQHPRRGMQMLYIRIAEFNETLLEHAPFGYIGQLLNVMEEIPANMGSDSVILNFPISHMIGENIEVDITKSEYSSIFNVVKTLSAFICYLGLGLFFFAEYKKITGGGVE